MGTTNSKLAVSGGLIAAGIILYLFNEDPEIGVSGISNMGNTCFLNSILQALSSCNKFSQFLFKLKPIQKSSEDYDALIINELSNFLKDLINGKQTSPENLILALSYKFPYFGQQHDSHEIFYVINESISEIRNRAENSFSFDLPLSNPLLGLMSTEIFCSVCKNKSIKLDSIFDVSVNVTSSLHDSFSNLYKTQLVDDFLCVKCSVESSLQVIKGYKPTAIIQQLAKKYNCRGLVDEADLVKKIKTKAFVGNKILKFPELLCIHCKWLVSHSSGFIHKKRESMRFPLILEVAKGRYELNAVIEHLGGSAGGHYLTYKRFQNS